MRGRIWRSISIIAPLLCCLGFTTSGAFAQPAAAPAPLVAPGQPVDWLFLFKLNAGIFPTTTSVVDRDCIFGGTPKPYPKFSQRYVFASSSAPALAAGPESALAGAGTDPLGATFAEIYTGHLNFVVWNDQFYQHPKITGCSDSCGGPWGHSKGVLAWNEAGEGFVLQVTTPSWPAAGGAANPRLGDGNTLGCIEDNDVKVSQDFFALRLTRTDVEKVLDALANASVVTDVHNPQLVQNGGPPTIRERVLKLGVRSTSTAPIDATLSTGVRLLSKPSGLLVPPWQLVSALLGGVDLRTATWWTNPAIPSTTRTTSIACWRGGLGMPGAVAIGTSGKWDGKVMSLKGGPAADANHGKIGVSTSGEGRFSIFGDMNQQGALSGNCKSSQNGRGGLFFVVDNAVLHASVTDLIAGSTAPTAPSGTRPARPSRSPPVP